MLENLKWQIARLLMKWKSSTESILKHELGYRYLQQLIFVIYNFNTIIVEIDDQLKLEELRKIKMNRIL